MNNNKLPDITELQKLFNNTTSSSLTTDQISNVTIQNDLSKIDEQIQVKEEIENSEQSEIQQSKKEGREVILYLDSVLIDQSKNHSRSGKVFKIDDPEIISLADLIDKRGLLNPSEVRPLKEPIERDQPTKYSEYYTHEVVSGYKRTLAQLYLLHIKKDEYYIKSRFTCFDEIDDDEAELHNAIENWGRKDPTEYDFASLCFRLYKKRGFNSKQIANITKSHASRIESLLLMFERLPKELIDIFRASPTPEIRRQLTKISSTIQRDTLEETHTAMIEAWNQYASNLDRKEVQNQNSKNNNNQHNNSTSRIRNNSNGNSNRISILRHEQMTAREWFDPLTNMYRRITDEQREYGNMLLQHLERKNNRSPFR